MSSNSNSVYFDIKMDFELGNRYDYRQLLYQSNNYLIVSSFFSYTYY